MATALSNAAPSAPPPAPDASVSTYLSDEEILGIFDETAITPTTSAAEDFSWDSEAPEPDAHSSFGRVRAPANTRVAPACPEPGRKASVPALSPSNDAGRDAGATTTNAPAQGSDADSSHDPAPENVAAQNEIAPIPAWLAEVTAAAPNAAPELANLWQRSTALETFDRAFYGADTSAQQQLISQLYSDDPAAFRAMVSAANAFVAPASVPALSPSQNASRDASATRSNSAAQPFAQFQPESVAQARTETQSVSAPPPGDRPEARPRHTPSPRGNDSPVGAHPPQVPRSPHRGDLSYSPPSSANNLSTRVAPASVPALSPSQNAGRQAGNTQPEFAAANSPAHNFNPAAYAQFEQSTNDAVVSDVSAAIARALDRALPAGIADGARRRIAGDTLAEVHTALRGDRQLASQVAEMLRGSFVAPASVPALSHFQNADRDALQPDSGQAGATQPVSHVPRFDNATRDAIARLISTRARGVVPEAARRVISEWTGSVLSAHHERTSRQQSAIARVDVVGSQAQTPPPRRAVKSADINYRATSDEDILSW